MKNEKLCFNKSIGMIILSVSVIVLIAFFGYNLSNTITSTSSRAAYHAAGDEENPAPLKSYFVVYTLSRKSGFTSLYDGSKSPDADKTLNVDAQTPISVCITHNAIGDVEEQISSPWDTDKSNAETIEEYEGWFNLKNKNSSYFHKETGEMAGCWTVRYDRVVVDTINGSFSPEVDGATRRLNTPKLTLYVNGG